MDKESLIPFHETHFTFTPLLLILCYRAKRRFDEEESEETLIEEIKEYLKLKVTS